MQMYAPPGVNAVTSATTGQPYAVAPGGAINALVADVPDLMSRGFTFVRMPFTLAQSGTPVILPSSGSSNASGQITHTTALPYQPSGTVQVYLPAGVVVGDATGGLYSAVYSSATVCQLVGNPTTANGAYVQTTNEVVLAAVTVSGGALGLNGSVRMSGLWSIANNANAKTAKIKFGGTTYYSAAPASSLSIAQTIHVRNRNATNAQVGPATNLVGGVGSSNSNPVFGAADTNLAQSASATGQLAVATDYMILEGYTVELLPG